MVSSLAPMALLTGSAKINITMAAIMPMQSPVQKQKEEAVLAFSVLPSPRDLEIREVPPMPKSIPIAIKKRNAGVATEIAATIGIFGLSYEKSVSQIVNQNHDHTDDGRNDITDDCFWYRGVPEYFCCFVLHNTYFLSEILCPSGHPV